MPPRHRVSTLLWLGFIHWAFGIRGHGRAESINIVRNNCDYCCLCPQFIVSIVHWIFHIFYAKTCYRCINRVIPSITQLLLYAFHPRVVRTLTFCKWITGNGNQIICCVASVAFICDSESIPVSLKQITVFKYVAINSGMAQGGIRRILPNSWPDESSLPPERSIILALFFGNLAKRKYWSVIKMGTDIAAVMIKRFVIPMLFHLTRRSNK